MLTLQYKKESIKFIKINQREFPFKRMKRYMINS